MSVFMKALAEADVPVVMEVKSRTGDGEDLLRGRSLAEIVTAYEESGAPCISVVTGRWFGGTEQLLAEVAALTGLPLLRKDFVTSGRQLRRTVELGASAVLLTARLLAGDTLRRLTEQALELDLTPFVEVSDAAEAAAVTHGDRCVVAVNNKDIERRERGPADLARSAGLLSAVRATGTPVPVSASGIADPAVAAGLLEERGYRALLVGTALLRAEDPRKWCAELARARSSDRAAERPSD